MAAPSAAERPRWRRVRGPLGDVGASPALQLFDDGPEEEPSLFPTRLHAWHVALGCAFLAPWAFARVRVPREIALVGMNPVACAAERIPVGRRLIQAMLLSGAIAALASSATILGYKGHFEAGLGAGAGFGGIAVAMLGRGSALGLVASALLFGTLEQGGLAINAHVPMESMQVLEGVIIGGGLGIRLGHPYAERITEAMQPHLFADSRPPHVHVAALGDLGGAIGAALLVE